MSKVVATYWDNVSNIAVSKRKSRKKTMKRSNNKTPQWFVFVVIVSITFMLCLAINFRAFSEMREQSGENTRLNSEIEKLTTENLILEKEIQNLKHDSRTIEREARIIGLSRPNEKILVPVN